MDRNLALELVRVTEAAALACGRWVGKGNKNAATDGAVAALTARAAILGALYNVKTNLNFIDDHKFLKEMKKEVKSLESRVAKKEKEILSHVDI